VLLGFDRVTVKSKGSDKTVHTLLDDITASFDRGGLGAVVGQSGSGKKTLLRAVAGIVECYAGRVVWKGRDLANVEDFYRNELGYVPQFSCVDELLTVRETLEDAASLRLGGSVQNRAARVNEVLKLCGLENLTRRKTGVLSGGQLRRLSLAIELIAKPTFLLCDEVTSGLDAQSKLEIWELLRSIASPERLVLMVTHGLAHVEMCDFFYAVAQGKIDFSWQSERGTLLFRREETQ
jgi:ABC-type multidrug transport system ATPase subunit